MSGATHLNGDLPSWEGIPGVEPNPHTPALPIFDLGRYLHREDDNAADVQQLCSALASCLAAAGALIVRDPRVEPSSSDRFLSLMERYFSQPLVAKMEDVRPNLAYQVGATPSGTEKPRCLHDKTILARTQELSADHQPTLPTGADAKWRFFWRIGDRPTHSRFSELNAEPVLPMAFPEWRQVMDQWGTYMLEAVTIAAEMLARGFGLPADAFTQRMRLGPHLLAPTGVDLKEHGKLGTVFAGFHYDLNFLTIHGKSRYPGLFIWLRNGERIPVRIPEGCLLIQAGKQMEWLTGGAVQAGFHEVLCTEETLLAVQAAEAAGKPTWRVSSTVFSQIASDEILRPLPPFDTEQANIEYPAVPAGLQVREELEAINLRTVEIHSS